MTRENDRKMGTSKDEKLDTYDQRVETRFDKIARAKQGPDGSIDKAIQTPMHADDGGDHPY